jgi:flagellar biogenesis protein FliO
MVQQMLAVLLVLGLLLGMLFVFRRSRRANPALLSGWLRFNRGRSTTRRMRVVERVALTPQHSLHLVMIENRLIVFAASPAGCQAVGQPWPAEDRDERESAFGNGAGA